MSDDERWAATAMLVISVLVACAAVSVIIWADAYGWPSWLFPVAGVVAALAVFMAVASADMMRDR